MSTTEYKLSYTAAEINNKLAKVDENATSIGQLSGEIEEYKNVNESRFEAESVLIGGTIKDSSIDYNNGGLVSVGYGIKVETENPISMITTKMKSSIDDTVICEIIKNGDIICTAESNISTELSELLFSFPSNLISGIVEIRLLSKNGAKLNYSTRGGGFASEIMPYENGYYFAQKVNVDHDWIHNYNTNTTLLLYITTKKAKTVKETVVDCLINSMNYIYVAPNGSDIIGTGSIDNPFATIYHANEIITDNSKENQYTIVAKQGTYTDLQEKYAGRYSGAYEGVCCKDYVYYESEDILRPDLCIIKWDGATGFSVPVSDVQIADKCPFHIIKNTHTHIKGFTIECQNTRYCQHIETVGSTIPCEWLFENVIFKWNGRPNEENAYTIARACVGSGYTFMEKGIFKNCMFLLTNANSNNHMVFQSHDNADSMNTPLTIGESIVFENCYVSIADGTEYAHIDLRQSSSNPKVSSSAVFNNISGAPLYISNVNGYGITLLGCTEKVN